MEDRHAVAASAAGWSLLAVLDGHGGARAAERLRALLPPALLAAADEADGQPPSTASVRPGWRRRLRAAVRGAVLALDVRLEREEGGALTATGSTLLAALWHARSGRLALVSVGDSRAALFRADGTLLTCTREHKPEGAEQQRVAEAGGFVRAGRVGGVLAMSRAMGDFALKKAPDGRYSPDRAPVSAEPQILLGTMPRVSCTLLLASDGLWDALSTDEAGRLLHASAEPARRAPPAEQLVRAAFARGSRDNITALVARLSPAPAVPPAVATAPSAELASRVR